MILVFIAAFFCVLNISVLLTLLLKFKKIFSTDDIISSVKEEMDNMISDMNRNAARNIDIIDDRIKQLKAAVAEADRHVENARRELENQKNILSYKNKIDEVIQERKSSPATYPNPLKNQNQYTRNQDISLGLQSANRYELTAEGSRLAKPEKLQQGDLFEQAEAEDRRKIVSDTGTTFTVESDGSSYASVPVIGGNVTYADNPIPDQNSFDKSVYELRQAGYSVSEIANKLNCSITEVQLALEIDSGF